MGRTQSGYRQILRVLLPILIAFLATDAFGGSIRSFGVSLGAGVSDRIEAVSIPLQLEIGLHLPEVLERSVRETPIRVEWTVKAWVAPILGEQTTAEAGFNPVGFRLAWDGGQRLVPFIDLSAGILVTGIRGIGAGGGFQFSEGGGAGFQWFWSPRTAVSLSYHYRHMSNARIYDQNAGLDTHSVILGMHWFPERVAK
jgi:hypothetical protein